MDDSVLVVRPAHPASGPPPAVVVVHEPLTDGCDGVGRTCGLGELAARLAGESGWVVAPVHPWEPGSSAPVGIGSRTRGSVPSAADPVARLLAAVGRLRTSERPPLLLAVGFGLSGVLAVALAAADPGVGGVGLFGTPADPARFERLVVRGDAGRGAAPVADRAASRALCGVDPVALLARVPPRPVLVVQGSEDPLVPLVDAHALVEATRGTAELSVIAGADHHLRQDPRAVAVLLGWLERALAGSSRTSVATS